MPSRIIAFCLLLTLSTSYAIAAEHNPAERYSNAYKNYLGATSPIPPDDIRNYVYFARDRDAMRSNAFLQHPRFVGAQIMYPWSLLEPERDKYDFSPILDDYRFLASKGKNLFVQLQDATFAPDLHAVPEYLKSKEFDGGVIPQRDDNDKPEGWVAKRWNPAVQKRFAKLLDALGAALDGKIEGINLQETAIGVNHKHDTSFSGAGYAEAVKTNMLAMKHAFRKSIAIQYANFMPDEWLPWDDKGYLRSIYQYGEKIGVGLGGPDLMFTNRAQLNHTIAMMHEGKFTVPLAIAVQDGNYIGETNSERIVTDRNNIVPALHAFAKDFMHVRYMFWSNQEPYFTEDVLRSFEK